MDLELRKKYVGASEVAALFGMHNYVTARELYHLKRGEIADKEFNKSMQRGKFLEEGLAKLYINDINHAIYPHQKNVVCPTVEGLAATPDFIDDNGMPVEFKTVRWMKDDTQPIEAHVIQVQTQMMCLGKNEGRLVYYDMMKDEFIVFHLRADETLQGLIAKAVARFWDAVRTDKPPAVEAGDVEVLNQVFGVDKEKRVDLTGDNELTDALSQWAAAKAAAKAADEKVEKLKAIIRDKMKDATEVKCGDFSAKQTIVNVKESVSKAHTMRRLTIKTPKGDDNE